MNQALLEVRGLSVHVAASPTPLLQTLDFALAAGECLTLVGESGAGKSLLAQAVMGALPAGLLAQGQVVINGQTSAAQAGVQRRALWGRQVALLPQEPWLALDPTMRVGSQLAESHAWVRRLAGGWRAARAAAAADLQALGLPDAAALLPGQLSGGMAQRVAFAAALAGGAQLLLVDEPTKGLDAALRGDMRSQKVIGEEGLTAGNPASGLALQLRSAPPR